LARETTASKSLAVLIRRPPLNSVKGAEGLRMAVGQGLANRVTVILADEAVWLATALKAGIVGGEDAGKHLSMLLRLKHRVWVEADSMARCGLAPERIREGLQVVTAGEVQRELLAADAVVVF
jgi:sulfur relay (sulfurtransferase) DsrF/TusC family protein